MLEKRIIPALLLSGPKLVKTIKFDKAKYIGDPINTVKIFNDKEVDELIIFDISCSKMKTAPNLSLLKEIASEAFMPLGYGGGISDLRMMESIFKLGYEKVSLNSSLFQNPQLLADAAKEFGSQSVLATIDVKTSIWRKDLKVYNHAKKSIESKSPLELARYYQELGCGEVIINFVDRDGTCQGYDLKSIKHLGESLNIPIVALGGAWTKDHLRECLQAGADAAAAGSMFIYHGTHKAVLVNYPKRYEIEEILSS